MSDPSIPFAALAQFHREVFVPDVERIVGASERRLHDEMHTLHAYTLTTLGRLEFEYQALKSGMARLEARVQGVEHHLESSVNEQRDLVSALHRLDERLSRVEKRLEDRVNGEAEYPSRSEVQDLRTLVDALRARVDALEKRLER